ncbi:AAA family ATPase [Paenibacillus sp. MMS18-CY102]|uniref:AAA family ATPase n=1 Tax=Paenibacillus sp. MMS18-CY102 TaxID=2682849 RepID=UPI0013664F94|nr:AAA family ATPase [Paenibacillus sp. MMS18-CY102]MWC30739.1 AAA family ATPase [Paenibacillus sp. MMS18-CY102]
MIRSIAIERFKHLVDINIELGNMNVFVGSNNAGKSSILQAVQFAISAAQTTTLEPNTRWIGEALNTSVSPNQLVYTPLRDVYALAPGGILREPRGEGISVTFIEDGSDAETSVLVGKGRNKNLTVRISGQSLGERLQNINEPYSIFVPGLAGIPAVEEYKTPGIVRKAAARGDANNVFRNILWLLKQNEESWNRFTSDLKKVFSNLKLNVTFVPDRDEHINATARFNDYELPIDSAGTGVLQAIQILSYVNLYKPKMLILDEPDSHLHPNNQRKLATVLRSLTEERDLQILLSTHSRHLIDELMESSKMHWIQDGKINVEDDYDTVRILTDIGALDKGERVLRDTIKYVFLTEDSNIDGVRVLLIASGFNIEEVDIWSYEGCAKVDTAHVLNAFIRKHAPNTKVILHRDRDYLNDDEIFNYKQKIENAGMNCFITDGTDMESHFLNAKHINSIYSQISEEQAAIILEQATAEVEDKTLEKFINSRTKLEIARVGPNNINPGRIATEAHQLYFSNKDRYRHGKKVVGCVKSKLVPIVGGQVDIIVPSMFIKNDSLNNMLDPIVV